MTLTAYRTTLTNRYARGVTLPELVVVAALLAIIAAAAVPNLADSENQRLRLSVHELRDALRHARDESIRTGVTLSLELEPGSHQVAVMQIADFTNLPVTRPITYHPVSKQPYQLDLDDNAATAGTRIQTLAFNFDSVGTQARIDFTRTGQPIHIDSSNQGHRMVSGTITLVLNNQQQTLRLDPLTGRITET